MPRGCVSVLDRGGENAYSDPVQVVMPCFPALPAFWGRPLRPRTGFCGFACGVSVVSVSMGRP